MTKNIKSLFIFFFSFVKIKNFKRMLHFLVSEEEGIPGAGQIKEKIVEEKSKLTAFLEHMLDLLKEYTPRVIAAIIVLVVGLWLIKRLSVLADKAMLRRRHDVSLRTFLKSLISIGLKIILIVTVAGMLGIGTTSFVTILGAAGLAVGLALQGSLSNFAGGVLILIFKPFKVGDTIEAMSMIGDVKEIQIFNTILLTGDHKTVILPNGPLSNGTIVNRTRFGTLRLEIELMVNNSNNIERVKEIIMEVLAANDKVLKDPEPGIFIGKVADGSVEIDVRPFCLPENATALTSDLYYSIYYAFEQNKIALPPSVRLVSNTIR
jgi:small conductance mechanosensitive channel